MKETKFNYYKAVNTGEYPLSKKKSEDGISLLQEGAFNLYAMVPCPLHPRFDREFKDYVEEYNKSHDIPLYVPTLAGIDHDEVEDLLKVTENIDDLPDAFVATGSHWQFSENFHKRFIKTGLFKPYFPPNFADAIPKQWKEISDKYGQGFLAIGTWDLVYDLSFGEDGPFPKRFMDLSNPEFKGKISIHSCDDSPGCMSLLQLIKDEGGSEALAGFARNVKSVKHFSQIIKGIDSGKSDRTPFNIIPGPATSQIPSNKRAAIIDLQDGSIPMQISILVRHDRMDRADEILSFFYGDAFRKVLSRGSFIFANELDPDRQYAFPNWEDLVACDADERKDKLATEFSINYTPPLGDTSAGKGCSI